MTGSAAAIPKMVAVRCMSMNEGPDSPDRQIDRRRFLQSTARFVAVGAGISVLAACGASGSGRSQGARPASGKALTLYREEGCSCCVTYADYLRESGFTVDVKTVRDLGPIRDQYDVPEAGVGCHTSIVDSYVVEGHVPVAAIDRLLSRRPMIDGISVVGMPINAPGMGEPNGQPLTILSFRAGRVADYMSVDTF